MLWDSWLSCFGELIRPRADEAVIDWLIVLGQNWKGKVKVRISNRKKQLLSRNCQLCADLKDGWWRQVEAVLCLWEGGGNGGHHEGAHEEEACRPKVKGPVQVQQLPRRYLQDCLQTLWESFASPEDEEPHERKAWDGNQRLQNKLQPGIQDLHKNLSKRSISFPTELLRLGGEGLPWVWSLQRTGIKYVCSIVTDDFRIQFFLRKNYPILLREGIKKTIFFRKKS